MFTPTSAQRHPLHGRSRAFAQGPSIARAIRGLVHVARL